MAGKLEIPTPYQRLDLPAMVLLACRLAEALGFGTPDRLPAETIDDVLHDVPPLVRERLPAPEQLQLELRAKLDSLDATLLGAQRARAEAAAGAGVFLPGVGRALRAGERGRSGEDAGGAGGDRIDGEGQRCVLALKLAQQESTTSGNGFFEELKERGLRGVRPVVGDDHAGLKRAVWEVVGEAL